MNATIRLFSLLLCCLFVPLAASAAAPLSTESLYLLLEEKEYEQALALSEEMILEIQAGLGESSLPLHCFSDTASRLLFEHLYPDASYQEISYDLVDALHIQAYALLELGDSPAAVAALEEALAYDPVGVHLRYELIANYEAQGRADRVIECLDEMWPLLLFPEDFGFFYRRVGYHLVDREELSHARYYLIYSLLFEHTDLAYEELRYIDRRLGDNVTAKLGTQTGAMPFIETAIDTVSADGLSLELSRAQRDTLLALRDLGGEDGFYAQELMELYESINPSLTF